MAVNEKYPIVEKDKYPIIEGTAAEKYPVVAETEPTTMSKGQAQEMLGLVEPEETEEEKYKTQRQTALLKSIPRAIEEGPQQFFDKILNRLMGKKREGPVPEEIRAEDPSREIISAVESFIPGAKAATGESKISAQDAIDAALLLTPYGKLGKAAGPSLRASSKSAARLAAEEAARTPIVRAAPGRAEIAQTEREMLGRELPPDLSGKTPTNVSDRDILQVAKEMGAGPREADRFLAQKKAEAQGVMTGDLPPAPPPKKTPYREPAKVIGQEPEGGITSPVEVVPGPPSKPVGEGWVKSGEEAYGVEIREAGANRSQGLGYAEVKKGADQGLRRHEVSHELIERAQKALDPETFSVTITDKISQKSWDRVKNEVKDWRSLRRDQQIDEAFAWEVQHAKPEQQDVLLGGINRELVKARDIRKGAEITEGIHVGPAGIDVVKPSTPEMIHSYSNEEKLMVDAALPHRPYIATASITYGGGKADAVVSGIPHKVDLKGKKFYNLDEDPQGYWKAAKKIVADEGQPGDLGGAKNLQFAMIKSDGWDGIKIPSAKQVRMFYDTPIIKPGPPGSPGFIQVEAIRDITGTAVGATTGATVDEDAWRGGVVGGAIGLALTHGIGRALAKGKYPKGTKFVKGGIEVPPIRETGIPTRPLEAVPPKLAPTQELTGKATEAMVAKGVKRDPSMLMSQQIMDEVIANPADVRSIAYSWGFDSPVKMMQMASDKVSDAARYMQVFSAAAKKLEVTDPVLAKMLNKIGKREPGAWDHFQDWYQKVDNIRRGLMVSQVATAMRNLETQGLRVMMEVPEKAIEAVLQKMFKRKDTVKWDDGLQEVFGLFQRNKKFADKVLANYPKEHSRMFGTFSSDVSTIAGKGWSYANKGVEALNVLNRGQEFMIRRAVMMGELNAVARNKGLDLAKMMKDGASLSDILTQKEAHALVDKTLEITFAKSPEYGTWAQQFITACHLPGISYLEPFARFAVNALKFGFEYSPISIIKLAKPSEWSKMAGGNFQTIARTAIGTTMFYTALQLRQSKYAGDLPWEFKWGPKDPITGDQQVWDTRPYNPFMNVFVMADIYKRITESRSHTINSSMIVQGILGQTLKMRAVGTVVDDALQALLGDGDDKKIQQRLAELGGATVGSWAVPMQTVKDLYDGFEASPYFDKSTSPIAQEFTTKVPGYAGETLASPTHAGPVMRESPALRQLTGVSLKTKNVFEQELDRFGYKSSEIFKSTGIREADNVIKQKMGTIAQEVMIPFIKSNDYKESTEEERDYIIGELLKDIRVDAREAAEEERPDLFIQVQASKIPKREIRLQKSYGLNINKEIEEAIKK